MSLLSGVITVDQDPSSMRHGGGDYEKPKEVGGVGQRKQSKGACRSGQDSQSGL